MATMMDQPGKKIYIKEVSEKGDSKRPRAVLYIRWQHSLPPGNHEFETETIRLLVKDEY